MKPIKELKELTLLDRFLFDETVEDPEAMKIILDMKGILETKKGSSEKVQELHNKINKIKLSEEIGVRYMNLWEEKAFDRHDGYVEGHAKGVEEGIEKGMIQTRIEIARNFKAAGIPIEVIAGNTGLTIEEIEAL